MLFTLCISSFTIAQNNFRGEIIYRLHASNDKQDAELKVLFGNNKLKIQFKEKEEYAADALIVLLDSGATYNLKPQDKTFKKKKLMLNSPAENVTTRTIMGFSTTAISPENNGMSGLLGGVFGSSRTLFFVSDSLHYFIPEQYKGNMEFVMVQKNKIVLGAEIHISNPYNDEGDSSNTKNIITAEAISIKPMAVNDNDFAIPADFTAYIPATDTITTMADTTMAMMDTTAFVPKVPAVKKKAPVKKAPAKKTTAKPKAVGRKDTN
jgi:hypothetical protein